MRDRQLAKEAEHFGQVFALRPVVAKLGLEVGEADFGVVPVDGLVDGEQRLAQQREPKPSVPQSRRLNSVAVLRRVWLALLLWSMNE